MTTLPALALALCPWFPRTLDGPACPAQKQALECGGCSECLTWDPVPDPPGSRTDFYEIYRTIASLDSWSRVGLVPAYIVTETPDGAPIRTPRDLIWCPPRDTFLPARGVTYRYGVRACRVGSDAVTRCSPGLPSTTLYARGPYACSQPPLHKEMTPCP